MSAMVWTRSRPTEPGAYWYQDSYIPPCVVYVNFGMVVAEWGQLYPRKIDDLDGQWCGPLEVPT